MKKLFTLLILLLLLSASSWALVSTYTFTGSSSTYTPITGGTLLASGVFDDNVYNANNIGFLFLYNGAYQSQFSVNANGWLCMGSAAVSSYTPISTGTSNNVISALGRDQNNNLATTSTIRYEVIGSAPNRTLVVQFLHLGKYVSGGHSEDYNYQIRLNETSNTIDIVYGTFAVNATPTTVEVGLRGATSADYNNRSTLTDWAITTAGAANTASCTLSSTVLPASGQKFTFTPPVLPAPADPISMTFTAVTGGTMTVNWVDNSTNETGFSLVRALDAGFTTGVAASYIASTTSAATGAACNSGSITGLNPSTTYYFKLFAVNDGAGSNGITGSQATNAAVTITSTVIGGLWNSPATWVGGAVPNAYDHVAIAAGSTVVVNQSVTAQNLTIDGKLQWITTTTPSATVNVMQAIDITVSASGKLYAHATPLLGATIKVTGNFTNNGIVNLAAPASNLTFNGTAGTQTLGGTGTFTADMTGRGMIQNLWFTSLAACDIATTQNLVTANLAHGAGSLNTNSKVTVDNTAICFGGLINRSITTVTVNIMGVGYTSAPTVAFTAAPAGGTTATGTADYDAATGTVRSITITNPGDGYRATPTVTLTGGGFTTTATAVASLYQVFNFGTNSLGQKSAIASVTGGLTIKSEQSVGSVWVTNGGVGYTTAPTVGFSLPTGYLNLVTAGGSGYTTAPTVVLTGGGYTTIGAATAVVCRGQVVSVNITTAGAGYTSLPVITFTGGGGGSGASATLPAGALPTATATIDPALTMVTSFTITNAGFGYTAAPTVTLTGGGFTTAATGATARIGLYNLTLSYFAPATSNATHTESVFIPANRRINVLALNSATGFGLNLTGDLELYSSSPFTLTGNLDMGGNTLTFSHPTYTGTAGGTTAYVSNGKITYKLFGSAALQTRTFPFNSYDAISGSHNHLLSMGTAGLVGTEGSTITTLTGSIGAAPTGTNMTGTRTLRLQTYGGLYGNLPTLRLDWNSVDALVGSVPYLTVAQATATSGPWTIRSLISGSGAINPAGGNRTTAISGVGPIAITGDDYFGWNYAPPACPLPSGLTATEVTVKSANLSWTPGGTETAWEYAYGVNPFPTPTGAGTATTSNTVNPISGLSANTSYQYYVRANCGTSFSIWAGPYTFFTGYCIPAPTSVDGSGITNVTYGTVNNTTGAEVGNYGDYTSMSSNVSATLALPVSITFSTGYTYDTKIWVDYNDNLLFTDPGEEVYTGTSLSTNPTTLAASFIVQAVYGPHRMRIGGVDVGPPTPCYASSYGSFEDYTINIVPPPTCTPPTTLTATSLAATHATLGWIETGTATAWEIQYGAVGFTLGAGTTVSANSNPFVLNGLTPGASYGFYVRAYCSVSDQSPWVGPVTFTLPDEFSVTLTAIASAYVSNLDKVIHPGIMHVSELVAAASAADTAGRAAMKFNLSTIPSNAIISKVTVNYYQVWNQSSSVSNYLYPLANDPSTATGAALWNDCADGLAMWTGTWPLISPGWYNNTLNSDGIAYVTSQLASGWAGVSIVRGSTFQYNFAGYNHATFKPYMTVDYHVPTTPIFLVTPSSFDFEHVNLGIQSLAKTFTIKNNGVGTLTISSVALTGADVSQFMFTDANTYPVNLTAGASVTVQVIFKPTSVGAKTASLTIVDATATHTVALSGLGYLNGPQNLTATNALATVHLAWEAPLPLEEIRYDDNTSEANYWVGTPSATTQYFYTKITIPVDGTLNSFAVVSKGGLTATTWESVMLCPESAGAPNLAAPIQSYASVPVPVAYLGSIVENLTSPLAVTAGQNFYIVTQWPAGSTDGPYVETDTHNDHQRCAYSINSGTTWSSVAMNFMMRAYMIPSGAKAPSSAITLISGEPTPGYELLPNVSMQCVREGYVSPKTIHVLAPAVIAATPSKSLVNYTVHRGATAGVYTTTFTGIGATSYVDNTVAPSTLYYYMVSSEYTNGTANSNEVSITSLASCPAPTTLNATTTPVSANLSWTEVGTATAWEYVYGLSPLAAPVGSGTVTASATVNPISSLTANTTYQFYVRSNCLSTWAGPFTFQTPCATTIAPFTEDFELATFPPSCWSKTASPTWLSSTTVSGYSVGTGSAEANFFSTQSTTPFDLVTMNFDASALISPQLVFDYAYATYAGEVDQLDVYYSTNLGSTYTLLLAMPGGSTGILNTGGATTSVFVPLSNQWATKTLSLPAGTNSIKFRAISAYGNNLYLDNIKVKGLEFNTTFNVDMSTAAGFTPGTDLVYLSGTFPSATWSEPGTNPNMLMSQVGSTLIYTKTLALPPATYEYKYFKNAGNGGGEYQGGNNRSAVISATTTLNDIWGGSINWANLQWPIPTGTITVGGAYDVYAQAYIQNGVTSAAGATTGLQAWIGYSTSDTDPSTWTNWVAAPFFGQSSNNNNDEFKANIGPGLAVGTYYYASRFQYGATGSYVYGGTAGFWAAGTSGVLTVNALPTTKTLNLTVFLESLLLTRDVPPAAGTMFQAYDDMGVHFGAGIADQITVELHNGTAYSTLEYSAGLVDLNVDGTATITIPAAYAGSYYITIKHRNSVETTSAVPVSFATSPIAYDFSTSASQAYGDNQTSVGGVFAIFCGDVDLDGSLGINDLGEVDNSAMNFGSGYVVQDVDGDGSVGISDMGAVDNNSMNFVGAILPPSKKMNVGHKK